MNQGRDRSVRHVPKREQATRNPYASRLPCPTPSRCISIALLSYRADKVVEVRLSNVFNGGRYSGVKAGGTPRSFELRAFVFHCDRLGHFLWGKSAHGK